jgi:NAD(P)-dependent dehydrogenase (short-subunit alcohol dehydrogenase family)
MLGPAAKGSNLKIEAMTQRIPLRRLGHAEEQAEAAVWLCSERAGFVSGLSLISDGGLSVLR